MGGRRKRREEKPEVKEFCRIHAMFYVRKFYARSSGNQRSFVLLSVGMMTNGSMCPVLSNWNIEALIKERKYKGTK
jgi:hypothetical protein